RLHAAQLAAPDDPRQEEDEAERGECPEDDVHRYGKIVTVRWTVSRGVSPSSRRTSWLRRPTFVALTWKSAKKTNEWPAAMWPRSNASLPSRLASPIGLGSSALTCIPS